MDSVHRPWRIIWEIWVVLRGAHPSKQPYQLQIIWLDRIGLSRHRELHE